MGNQKILIDIERMKYANNGLYYYCAELVQAINQSQGCRPEYDVTLFAPRNVADHYRNTNDVYQHRSIFKYYLPHKSRYDLWHATYQNSRYFPFSFKGKIVYTIHDFNFLYENKTAHKKRKYLDDIQRKIDMSDTIVAVSNFVKSEIIRYCTVDPSKIVVIYNGCNIAAQPVISQPRPRPECPFFFTIGTILQKKNFRILPSMLLKNDFHLIIAGDRSDQHSCKSIIDMARSFGVHNRVKLIGNISNGEKNWYLQNCLALPFPSFSEGFGLPVIEAMHFGKPTLLSRFTSLPEIGGKEAYYLDNFEPEYVAGRTMDVLDDYNNDMAKKGQIQRRAKEFSWEKAAEKYWGVYERLLGEGMLIKRSSQRDNFPLR